MIDHLLRKGRYYIIFIITVFLIFTSFSEAASNYINLARSYGDKSYKDGQKSCGPTTNWDCSDLEGQALLILAYDYFYETLADTGKKYLEYAESLANSQVTLPNNKICKKPNFEMCPEDIRGMAFLGIAYLRTYEITKNKDYLDYAKKIVSVLKERNKLCEKKAMPFLIFLYAYIYEITLNSAYREFYHGCNLDDFSPKNTEELFWAGIAYIKINDIEDAYTGFERLLRKKIDNVCNIDNLQCPSPVDKAYWLILLSANRLIFDDNRYMEKLRNLADNEHWKFSCKNNICSSAEEQSYIAIGYSYTSVALKDEKYKDIIHGIVSKTSKDCPNRICKSSISQGLSIISRLFAISPDLSFLGIKGHRINLDVNVNKTQAEKDNNSGNSQDPRAKKIMENITFLNDRIEMLDNVEIQAYYSKKIGKANEFFYKKDYENAEKVIEDIWNEMFNKKEEKGVSIVSYIKYALFVILIVIAITKSVKRKKTSVEDEYSDLIVYITDQMVSGYDFSSVKDVLVDSGYEPELIDKLKPYVVKKYIIDALERNIPIDKIKSVAEMLCDSDTYEEYKTFIEGIEYLVSNLEAGYTIEDLRKQLRETGYSQQEIEKQIKITKNRIKKIAKDNPDIKDIDAYLKKLGFLE